eukprot:scaffold7615_cov139-Skeletonema_menzelii.AAC.5
MASTTDGRVEDRGGRGVLLTRVFLAFHDRYKGQASKKCAPINHHPPVPFAPTMPIISLSTSFSLIICHFEEDEAGEEAGEGA